jgi:hypothetical protein
VIVRGFDRRDTLRAQAAERAPAGSQITVQEAGSFPNGIQYLVLHDRLTNTRVLVVREAGVVTLK